MIINKIRYKNKIDFDFFEIWFGKFHGIFEGGETEENLDDVATCVSTSICPWCTKKYGLYEETNHTPESVEEEIEYLENGGDPGEFDPCDLDYKCGIAGCMNGAADYMDLEWKDFAVVD